MADDAKSTPPADTPPDVVAPAPPAPAAGRLDETVPGGAYRRGGGWVNAEGQPIPAPEDHP